MEKISFNKRISNVKREVFNKITNSNELGSLAGSRTNGYYSLNTIFKYLYPILDSNNVDIDLEILTDSVICTWYDCLEDAKRSKIFDLTDLSVKLSKIEKLPLMPNEVQSAGAVVTYIRRYALTNMLGLNATDVIEKHNNNNNNNNNYNNSSGNIPGHSGSVSVTDTKKYITTVRSTKEITRLNAIGYSVGYSHNDIKELIEKKYNKISSKNLTKEQYNYICDLLEKKEKVIDRDDKKSLEGLMKVAGIDTKGVERVAGCNYAAIKKSQLAALKERLNKKIEKDLLSDDLPFMSEETAEPSK